MFFIALLSSWLIFVGGSLETLTILVITLSAASPLKSAFLKEYSTDATMCGIGMDFGTTAKLRALLNIDSSVLVRSIDDMFKTHHSFRVNSFALSPGHK